MIWSYGEVPTAFSSVSTPWVSTAFSSVTTTPEPKGYGEVPLHTADVDVDNVDDVHDDVDDVDSSVQCRPDGFQLPSHQCQPHGFLLPSHQ